MTLLQIERKRLLVGQISLLWLGISILVPVLYFGSSKSTVQTKQLLAYEEIERKINAAPEKFSDEEINALYKSVDDQRKQDADARFLALACFEIVSITGLLLYRHRQKILITMDLSRKFSNRSATPRLRELLPFP